MKKFVVKIELTDKEYDFLKKYVNTFKNIDDEGVIISSDDEDVAYNLDNMGLVNIGAVDSNYEGYMYITKIGLNILKQL